jgi:transposase InsO family protein
MPWKEMTKVEQRIELVTKWQSGLYTITELSDMFGVSRPTVYTWLRRFEELGEVGLSDRPPIAKSHPNQKSAEIQQAILAAKREHPRWGPRKLIDLLRASQPTVDWGASSTAGDLLKAHGLVQSKPKRGRSRIGLHHEGLLVAKESGDMNTADYKGQFQLVDKTWCHPLTLNDPVSRYYYAIDAVLAPSAAHVIRVLMRVFSEFGSPVYLGSDNGNPFRCTRAIAGLSQVSVWLIRQGVIPVYTFKHSPWQNGRHERAHRTLKDDTMYPRAKNIRQMRTRFDVFRREYNDVRPHDSLGGKTPASQLKPGRPFMLNLKPLEYPADYEVRTVMGKGQVRFQGDFLYITQSLAGERIGITETGDGVWSIFFAHLEIGRYDERTKTIS